MIKMENEIKKLLEENRIYLEDSLRYATDEYTAQLTYSDARGYMLGVLAAYQADESYEYKGILADYSSEYMYLLNKRLRELEKKENETE